MLIFYPHPPPPPLQVYNNLNISRISIHVALICYLILRTCSGYAIDTFHLEDDGAAGMCVRGMVGGGT